MPDDALLSQKQEHELRYWRRKRPATGPMANEHYQRAYTEQFGLDASFYAGKRVLDVGCGPRGSLEWADMAAERVGLDPLADAYLELGADEHAMDYVAASSEAIPFPDGHFDVVCSFNSLDHVDDLDQTVAEIVRVIAPGGRFLLLTDVNHRPTVCEPVAFSWDVVDRFAPPLRLIRLQHFEKCVDAMYASLVEAVPYDEDDPATRYGILAAMFRRPV